LFFVCTGSDTYPDKAYVFDLTRQDWVDAKTFPAGITCSYEMPDTTGALRPVVVQEAVGAAPSRHFFDNMGISNGAHPSTVLNGTVTGGGANTLSAAGGSFYNSDQKLKAVAVTLIRAADSSEETRIVSDNSDSELTTEVNWIGDEPVNGDSYRVAPIESRWRSGRISLDYSDRKKEFFELWLWVAQKTCVPFYVNLYFNGSATPESDWTARNEDGVRFIASNPDIRVDPTTTGQHRYRIPLMKRVANDVAIEIFSSEAGEPWEILDAVLVGFPDPSEQAREE